MEVEVKVEVEVEVEEEREGEDVTSKSSISRSPVTANSPEQLNGTSTSTLDSLLPRGASWSIVLLKKFLMEGGRGCCSCR